MTAQKPQQHHPAKSQEDHDSNFKLLFDDPVMVRELLEDFVPEDIVAELDFSTLERLPEEHIEPNTRKTRRKDRAWKVRKKDGSPCYVAIILEFQSKPDYYMALRILAYIALLLQDLAKTEEVKRFGLPPILAIVIYNGPSPWNAPRKLSELFVPMSDALRALCPEQSYILLNIRELAEEALADKGIAAQVFRMERCRGIEELRELLRDGARRFRDKKYEGIQRVITDWLKTVVLDRLHITEPVRELHDFEGMYTMLEQSVGGWKEQFMRQHEQEFRQEYEREFMRRRSQEFIQQGIAQGMAQGMAQGEARGFLNALFSCVGDGLLPIAAAAAKANMSEDEFRARMRERETSKDS